MKVISLDFGGSTVDAVLWNGDLIESIKTYESKDVPALNFESFFEFSGISLSGVDKIFVTGGKSRFFADSVNGVPVVKVSEIDAIGVEYGIRNTECREEVEGSCRNSKFGIRYSNRLVVSMGTGTCMVSVKEGMRHEAEGRSRRSDIVIKHIGGTGVGGGTFVGLGRELLGVSDVDELLKIAAKGSSKKVDVSVSDIVGGDIGRVSGEATASNFGRLRDEIKFKKEDLAAGIVNLIGQTIGISAVFAAKSEGLSSIVLIGKLTKADAILAVVKDIIEGYGLEVFVPENAEYATAVGAKFAGERLIG